MNGSLLHSRSILLPIYNTACASISFPGLDIDVLKSDVTGYSRK